MNDPREATEPMRPRTGEPVTAPAVTPRAARDSARDWVEWCDADR